MIPDDAPRISLGEAAPEKGRLTVLPPNECPRGPAAGWRTSTRSTTARPPACLQVASGRRIGDEFVVDPPATPPPAPATGFPSPQHGAITRVLRLRGGAGEADSDIIDNWEARSGLSRLQSLSQGRSTALQEVDRLLRLWKDGGRKAPDNWHQNEGEVQDVLRAIDRWSATKQGGQSRRESAIRELRDEILGERDAVRRRNAVSEIQEWLAGLKQERFSTSQQRRGARPLSRIDQALLDWQKHADRYATEPVLELRNLLAAEQEIETYQRSYGRSSSSQSVRVLDRGIKERREIVENQVRTRLQEIDPELAPYVRRKPDVLGHTSRDLELAEILIAPRDENHRPPALSVLNWVQRGETAFKRERRKFQDVGVSVAPGVDDSQILQLVKWDRESHPKPIYPELSHYLRRRDQQARVDRATLIDLRKPYYTTIHGVRIWVDGDPTDDFSERLEAFTDALGMFRDAGYSLPAELKLFLPKYRRRLTVVDQRKVDISNEGLGLGKQYAAFMLPNVLVINPDIGGLLKHAVASRYARPAVGAIVHELFHLWHASESPEKFADLRFTELTDAAKAVLAKVSSYAASSPHEAVAEIMTAYMNRETLRDDVRRILEALAGVEF